VSPVITLLTDFGSRDGYVAAVKGVLLARCPGATLVDVTHEIPPGDVAAAAFVLGQATPYFPGGSVHLAVVDPGVGSERRAVACAIADQLYVAPDNGLLTRVLEGEANVLAHRIEHPALRLPSPSHVFHGRDLFAPAAAHLASGAPLAAVGSKLASESLVRAAWPEPSLGADGGEGCVVYVDRFGNLVSNLPVGPEPPQGAVAVAGREVPIRRAYSDVSLGSLVALCGSSGLLEIALNRGSAAEALGAGPGDVVTWRRPPRK
jgi:S-adenosylmethionine hydrolase